ncbi:MAG: 30S ribosomal protein S1 [Candidatus Latescibacteria bacterium]|nr:30S ribosomal protein S1 [Candidatus Latescibacterota bacterium]NIM21330.1 30S ribosomal protein S1 [Candidatus Latescibacterota bacterium]NIM65511.1 30S ribosomal protein S1 [Candidatus Latescibacterota bacterium]NIO01891.1 30S ribosomal protein S1 [Candidatus Latescibacterota bacterium]NIO28704.1 30S ribosomal protein S1 [Candidatus Latescibacterota bacterium]
MAEDNLGAQNAPEQSKIPLRGGDESHTGVGTTAPPSKTLRSPAYASFEILDDPETEVEEQTVDESYRAELTETYDQAISTFEEGQIVQGVVSEIRENEIIVDVGFKSEGSISAQEFRGEAKVELGDRVDVFLEKLENQDGLVVLSKEKADFYKVWGEIKNAYDTSSIMEGKVTRRIKGGLVVNLLGVDAFLPGSQIALRQVPNLDELIGQALNFKIIKINKRRRNIVVSRRIVLEEERREQKRKLLTELEVGEVREGVVKNITDFGAFVDLGGVDGLLHLTDMTWGRISHPSEVVAIGDNLKVKVLDFDREKEKISLGLKQLTPYPWDGVEERYPIGEKVRGKVVSITDYGAFVELEKGVEGLIHISEMSWTRHVKHPSKILAIGETVEAMVLKVDKENQKISLGLKQVEPDPWANIEERYPIGTRLTGRVRNLTNFGAFVEIEDGIDGLLHISDMSWAKRVRHPSEIVKKNDRIEVAVLDISEEKKRISLGMKQLTENPWDQLAEEYSIDTDTQGKITRLLDRGAVVELREDVEGFVPIGQMAKNDVKHPEEYFAVGDNLSLRVIKIDPKNKRIVLSISAYLKNQDEETVKGFHERFHLKERIQPKPEADAEPESTREDEGMDQAEPPEEKTAEAGPTVQDPSPPEKAELVSEETPPPAGPPSDEDEAEKKADE